VQPFDLHSHSTASDGLLSPSALVARAIDRGVDVLALTDHDDTDGLAEAAAAARGTALTLVPGAELSASWGSHTVHIIGLHLDAANRVLEDGLATIRAGRDSRARRIAKSLAEAGIANAYEGARKYVTSDRLISRSHFARYLVEKGYAKDMHAVFKRYLSPVSRATSLTPGQRYRRR
jgi:predicted metal-dependent phosphoesterase TrpH